MGASHLDLTAVSRAMREAATSEDLTRLCDLLDRFRDDLVEHAREEAEQLGGAVLDLRGVAVEIVLDGQQRLLDIVQELVDAMEAGDLRVCRLRTVELDARLRRQVRLEATLAIDGVFGRPSREN